MTLKAQATRENIDTLNFMKNFKCSFIALPSHSLSSQRSCNPTRSCKKLIFPFSEIVILCHHINTQYYLLLPNSVSQRKKINYNILRKYILYYWKLTSTLQSTYHVSCTMLNTSLFHASFQQLSEVVIIIVSLADEKARLNKVTVLATKQSDFLIIMLTISSILKSPFVAD